MGRHFLALYLLIVITLAAVSWGEDRLLQLTAGSADRAQTVTVAVIADRLEATPAKARQALLSAIAAKSGASLELFARQDIAGRAALEELDRGRTAFMQSSGGRIWALKELDDRSVLAYEYDDPDALANGRRHPLEWLLTLVFYAAIALVLMIWIWPLRRDLRTLERAAAGYGNRNWSFVADIKSHSQIHPLADTFRKMAQRIDGLIASHKDMSSAVSHEIKTPLARMRFEIELAREAADEATRGTALDHLEADVIAINDLVSATMGYAILERADLALNLGTHDFTALVPALAEQVVGEARPGLAVRTAMRGPTAQVVCDLHLIELALKNLLYNAARYARQQILVSFAADPSGYELSVDDDGPGIAPADRRRVFDSFVQLDAPAGAKSGFGLGLAIVRRALEWHDGDVTVSDSPLGGACLLARWPASPRLTEPKG